MHVTLKKKIAPTKSKSYPVNLTALQKEVWTSYCEQYGLRIGESAGAVLVAYTELYPDGPIDENS